MPDFLVFRGALVAGWCEGAFGSPPFVGLFTRDLCNGYCAVICIYTFDTCGFYTFDGYLASLGCCTTDGFYTFTGYNTHDSLDGDFDVYSYDGVFAHGGYYHLPRLLDPRHRGSSFGRQRRRHHRRLHCGEGVAGYGS